MDNMILEKFNDLTEAITKLEIVVFSNLVSWDSVQHWEQFEAKNIAGTMNTLLYKEENVMIFETIIPPGVTFTHHWHDFEEHNFIISGFYTNAGSVSKSGKWLRYESYEAHNVSNESESTDLKIIVIFTKK
jgi:hypothetical protein